MLSAAVRDSARTRASSSAMAAPWAMLGEVAWAASPMSSTGPCDQESSTTSSIGPACPVPVPFRASSSASSRVGTGSAYPASRSRSGGGGPSGAVAVAVDPSVADRDGQKRRDLTEQDRPHRRRVRLGDDEAVGVLADRAGRRRVEDQPPHRRVQPVRAQDEVVAVAATVAELDGDAVVVDGDRLRGLSPPDRHIAGPGDQHLMQCRPVQGLAGADTVPQVGRLDVEEQASAVVGDPLSLYSHRALGHLCAKPETVEGTYGVAGQVDPGALGRRAAARSTISTAPPQPRSVRAAARPAIPAPTMSTRTPSPRMCPSSRGVPRRLVGVATMSADDPAHPHHELRRMVVVPNMALGNSACEDDSGEHEDVPPARPVGRVFIVAA